MNVLILGIDGYLGWPLANYLAQRGHRVSGIDSGIRRNMVGILGSGSISAMPILPMLDRLEWFNKKYGYTPVYIHGNYATVSIDGLRAMLRGIDAVVHFAEIPSAPYSMQGEQEAVHVMENNVIGTMRLLFAMRDVCPDAHLLKLGTMGEYGTPNIDIPEGFFEIVYNGRKDTLPFPRNAGSWYHWTKVHDSNNIMFACKTYGLRATDVMQGVVYGTRYPELQGTHTRLDFDEAFGTAINRFVCQAVIGHPLTVYGSGKQQRGFLPLADSMECLTLALENPPDIKEYRVFNQLEQVYSIIGLAKHVQEAAVRANLPRPDIAHYENPRHEAAEHYYNPQVNHLRELGYVPQTSMDETLDEMFSDLNPFRTRLQDYERVLVPRIQWDGGSRKANRLDA